MLNLVEFFPPIIGSKVTKNRHKAQILVFEMKF